MVAYEGSEPFVFVSYAHKDKKKVLPIVEGLQSRGFRVWYDKRGISAGSEWAEVIADHVKNCHCMLAFVSCSFGDSINCREELSFAKRLEKTILAVYLEEWKNLRSDLQMRLSPLHSLDMTDYGGCEEFLDEISEEEALQPCLGAAAEPAKPVEPGAEELYQQAVNLGRKKEYTKAVPLLRKAAEQGHAMAQFNLGVCYQCGEGVAENQEEAAKWYRKAAEQGHADAQNNLGVCYQYGEGVRKNKAEARKWYQKAADQGHKVAIIKLMSL